MGLKIEQRFTVRDAYGFRFWRDAEPIRSNPSLTLNPIRQTWKFGSSEDRSCVYLAVPQTIASSVDEVEKVC